MASGKYKVLVTSLTHRTSKPTDPFQFKRYARGSTITLSDPEDIQRLLEGGAIAPADDDEALQERAALTPTTEPGTGGGAGFVSGPPAPPLSPQQEADRVAAETERLSATSAAAKKTAARPPK